MAIAVFMYSICLNSGKTRRKLRSILANSENSLGLVLSLFSLENALNFKVRK